MKKKCAGQKKIKLPFMIVYLLIAWGGFLLGASAVDEEPAVSDSAWVVQAGKLLPPKKDDVNRILDGGVAESENKAKPVSFEPSPEPSQAEVNKKKKAFRQLPKPNAEGGVGKIVLVVEIRDVVDMGLSALVKRAIQDNVSVSAIVFDINTPGGRIDAATEIRDAIMDVSRSIKTVAYIHPRAISAGAFISLACDFIFINDGGSIGAATPVSIDGEDVVAAEEKMVSYFRAEMASTARAKGRSGKIAEAMVDASVEIKGVSPAGKLLTLDTNGALKHGIADAKANTMEEVLEKLALPKATVKNITVNWAERLARIFTHPILSGILMSIGILGIFVEIYQPGFGFPGVIGLVCLTLFFAGHMVVHLAGFEELVLFVVGVGLLIAEIYVTPGFGVLGVLGLIVIIVSLVLSLSSLPLEVTFNTGLLAENISRVLVSVVASGIVALLLMLFVVKVGHKNKLVLQTSIDTTASGDPESSVLLSGISVGDKGIAESYLRPAGIGRFGRNRMDVITEGGFVEKSEAIVVVAIEGSKLVVKKEHST